MTDRKRAAAMRLQRRQRDQLPLLAPLIAEDQPSIDNLMTTQRRSVTGSYRNRAHRDRQAGLWRQARRLLDQHGSVVRRALLDHWNHHRWLPGDTRYLLDMLHGFETGRLVLVDREIRWVRVTISSSETLVGFGPSKPIASGWCNRKPGRR